MDDTTLRTLAERLEYLRGLQERRDTVKKSIEEQGKLTDELSAAIDEAATLAALEDIYRPYKPKRRTRATVAKRKRTRAARPRALRAGQRPAYPEELAKDYIDPGKGVETVEDALAGASDIIAEMISDNADIRSRLRDLISAKAVLKSEAATEGRTASTGSIMTSARASVSFRGARSSPSTAAKEDKLRSASDSTGSLRSRTCAAPS